MCITHVLCKVYTMPGLRKTYSLPQIVVNWVVLGVYISDLLDVAHTGKWLEEVVPTVPPRLFQCSNASGFFNVEEIFDFAQAVSNLRISPPVIIVPISPFLYSFSFSLFFFSPLPPSLSLSLSPSLPLPPSPSPSPSPSLPS